MPQISTTVSQEVVDAINKIKDSNHKLLQKTLPHIEELSFSEITAALLCSHPQIQPLLKTKK